jgi:hypothetical protein
MQYDKFIQAAGRLRQLSRRQSLRALVPPDVARHIREVCELHIGSPIHVLHLLQWTLCNTVEANCKVRQADASGKCIN